MAGQNYIFFQNMIGNTSTPLHISMEQSKIKHRDNIINIPHYCTRNLKVNETVSLYLKIETKFNTPGTHNLAELVSAAKIS
jgi:hypothetical protein